MNRLLLSDNSARAWFVETRDRMVLYSHFRRVSTPLTRERCDGG